ncbi:hypothetical protein HJC23_001236 [Cyclotella cryptica]|uniref:Pseudouridine synthase RsuA/RluA-like domain-containing protein n=1 Tax=Cyclotella cryptica TaxID=29204 RepID=A0ABD3QV01_9STRA
MKLMAVSALFSSTIAVRSARSISSVLRRRSLPCEAFLSPRSGGLTNAKLNTFDEIPVSYLSRRKEKHNQILNHQAPSSFTHLRFSSSLSKDASTINEISENDVKTLDPQRTYTDVDSIANILRDSYNIGETDQVQDAIIANSILPSLFRNMGQTTTEEIAYRLIDAAIKAATEGDSRLNRGALSAIVNAILACCCSCHKNELPKNDENDSSDDSTTAQYPELAWAILQQMDEMHSSDENVMVSPDLVSLSLVYYSLQQFQKLNCQVDISKLDDFYSEAQSVILDRARKAAKKSAGSQRRKALAAERRRKPSSPSGDISAESTIQLEKELQSIYGPDICLLHDDNDVLIVSKPSGMVCYHNKKTGAGKVTASRKKKSRASINKGDDLSTNNDSYGTKAVDISLEDALLDLSIPLSTLNPSARGIVHRLDRGTSGAIVLAKNDDAHLRLVALFFLRRVKKKYLALIPGRPLDDGIDVPFEGVIDLPVDGRPALSKYRVIRLYSAPSQTKQNPDPAAILLEVETLTGRKHQVRVHCANGLRRPIFLDPLYSVNTNDVSPNAKDGKNKDKSKKKGGGDISYNDEAIPAAIRDVASGKEQFFLHAQTLSISEMGMHVESPLPLWWDGVLGQWDEINSQ